MYLYIGNSSNSGSGGSNDPPKKNPKLPKEHEYDSGIIVMILLVISIVNATIIVIDRLFLYQFSELDKSKDGPIIEISLGSNGRMEKLKAKIRKHHLRPKNQPRGNITDRVRNFVKSLGQVKGAQGVRESDEVGHIIGDLLGGPCDKTYNFFPQAPYCNMDYFHTVENIIHKFLDTLSNDAYVEVDVQLVYVDYIAGISPNRPRMLKLYIVYFDGSHHMIQVETISNM